MKKNTTMKKGFTLVELMVVIAIIALLSSIVLASLGAAREKANVSKFTQEMSSIVTALELYRQANGGAYPPLPPTDMNSAAMQAVLAPYFKDTIVIPDSLSPWDSMHGLFYAANPTGSGPVSCQDTSATEAYVVYFLTTDPNLSLADYPQLYLNGAPSSDYRCAFVSNK